MPDKQATLIEDHLATKRDLEERRLASQCDFMEMGSRLRYDLTLRLEGMLVTGVAVVAALDSLL